MDQLIPTLQDVVVGLMAAFRLEAGNMFRLLVGAWIACLGRRSISRVWDTTGQADQRNHAAAFRLFSQAAWNWDEVGRLLLLKILAALVPGLRVWIVADDTLSHKRGAKVALGGTASAYQTRFRDRTSVRKAVLAMHETILPRRLSFLG